MPRFALKTNGVAVRELTADTWLAALGAFMEAEGALAAARRLRCELLDSGEVIALDEVSGRTWRLVPAVTRAPTPIPQTSSGDEVSPPALVEGMGRVQHAATAVIAWELALEIAGLLAPSECGAAVQATPHQGLFFVAATGPHGSKLRAARLPPGTGFVGVCVEQCAGFVVNNVSDDQRHYKPVDQETGYRTRAVLCAPVVAEGYIFGCLELVNPTAGHYTGDQLILVERLCAALGQRLYRAGIRGKRPAVAVGSSERPRA
ncbi:GAF domain-containing protein [Myxococcota bacterium]|nr:GAF domain-containing protein [Myxococcota bacterium]